MAGDKLSCSAAEAASRKSGCGQLWISSSQRDLALNGCNIVAHNQACAEATNMTLFKELQAVMTKMAAAYAARDATGCAALFVEDRVLYSPYAEPARGRAEIEVLHVLWTAHATTKQIDVRDCGGDGNTAWALSAYTEGTPDTTGTSLCVFERTITGDWLIRVCALHGDFFP